jgi:hypothetical protein
MWQSHVRAQDEHCKIVKTRTAITLNARDANNMRLSRVHTGIKTLGIP